MLAFVLHSFDADGRVALLRRATAALADDGRIGVLDWARPRQPRAAALWEQFLGRLEPHPTGTRDILHGALGPDIAAAGLRIVAQHTIRTGQAQLLRLAPARTS